MFSSRPKLLSDIIRHLIERHADMVVIGEVIDPIELLFALRATPADVVIITPLKANGDPRICGQLLKEHPHLRILILTPNSETLYVYQAGSERTCTETPSEQLILGIIRNTTPPPDRHDNVITLQG